MKNHTNNNLMESTVQLLDIWDFDMNVIIGIVERS